MTELDKFITLYLDDYVKMSYRRLIQKVDLEKENQLIMNLYYLLDEYSNGELQDYIHYNKIV